MAIIFFDLEWNTGFMDGTSYDEIIEIGAVKVDGQFHKTASFQRLVKPAVYRRMNPYIGKIISITMDDLKNADPMETVARQFFDWCGPDATLVAWSTNDFGVWERNLARIGQRFPQGFSSYDLQAAYSYKTENSIRSYSLKTAVEALEIPAPEEQTFHDAYYDALYTAAIGRKLYEVYGSFPTGEELAAFKATQCKPKKPKIPLKYSVKKAVHAPENRFFTCPVCGNSLRLQCWYLIDDCHFIGEIKCRCGDTYYPELLCDHFRQDKCDTHLTLWGQKKLDAATRFTAAQQEDNCILLYRRRTPAEKSPSV